MDYKPEDKLIDYDNTTENEPVKSEPAPVKKQEGWDFEAIKKQEELRAKMYRRS